MNMGLYKKSYMALLAMALLASCSSRAVNQADLESQAREITQQFTATLLPTLQQALADGGPVRGIEVCSTRAPEIADALAAGSSWAVTRVSLNPRNNLRAIPDSWERGVLKQFEDRQKEGATGAELNQSGIVDGEFRYMQAQLAMPLCLTCHGSNLAADVSAALRQYYPDDLATGYAAGDVRGAISLRHSIK
jgi:hypothetical protein